MPVVALPLTAAGSIIGHTEDVVSAAAASTLPLVTGALAAALFTFARALGAGSRFAVATAVGAFVGTYLLPYGKDFFAEPRCVSSWPSSAPRGAAGPTPASCSSSAS